MSMFFTSDQHFYHEKIIEYCDRPFKNTSIMNNIIIQNHNSVVKKDDVIYHVGNFSLEGSSNRQIYGSTLGKLNGTHHLILGSHDRVKPLTYVDLGFESVHTSLWLLLEDINFVLAHDPATYVVARAKDKNCIMLCGHVHYLFKTLLPEERVINVGVDVWNFTPVSLEQIINLIRK